jgi:hypothetical protein
MRSLCFLGAYIFKFFQRTWEDGGYLSVLDRMGKPCAHTPRSTETMGKIRISFQTRDFLAYSVMNVNQKMFICCFRAN